MDFDLGPNNTLVAESARSFANKFIKPHIMDWDLNTSQKIYLKKLVSLALWVY